MAEKKEKYTGELKDSGELKYSGELKGNKYSGTTKPKKRTKTVISRVNRTLELHVSNRVYVFGPYGQSQVLEKDIDTVDFKQQSDKLLVKE